MPVHVGTPRLIGREHPSEVLRGEIARATASHGGLVLVTGEAGIGKTMLVSGAAEEAREQGALVLSGSCWNAEGAPGYWPWIQVLRSLRRAVPGEEWSCAEELAGGALAVLLGEGGAGEEEAAPEGGDRAGPEAFLLHDAVTTTLVSASQHRPLVLVLEDLHWADPASLRLLEFVSRHTWFERLLLVGTYRDAEVEPAAHPLRELLVPLQTQATTITLTGLEPSEVADLVARTVGRQPDAEVTAEVHRRTGGNPFFVEQTARLWRSAGTVTAMAPGVREALRHRLSLLPAPVERLLTDAAVLGPVFARRQLAASVGQPVPQVDRLLEQAVAARLVVSRGGGRFAFAHDLVRETLYDALEETDAQARHAAVVRALDDGAETPVRPLVSELARHAHLAGEQLEPERAVHLLLAAANDAEQRMAADEAVGHHRRAHRRAAALSGRRRVVVGVELSRRLRHAGQRAEAERILREAAALARQLGDATLLARVALTVRHDCASSDLGRSAGDLLAEAHRALFGSDRTDRLLHAPEELARELTVRAVVLARRGDDDEALAFSLWARHDLLWGPGTAAEREALTDEMITVARRSDDPETEYIATSLRWVAMLEQGDPRYLGQFQDFLALAERHGEPLSLMSAAVDSSIMATIDARFEEAAEELERAVQHDDGEGNAQFAYMIGHLRWAPLLLQGRFGELAAVHAEVARGNPAHAALLQGIVAAERGDADGALRQLTALSASRDPLPRAYGALWLRFQAQTAVAAGDPELCERARAALVPYAGEWAVSLYGCDVSGPVAFWLAELDAAQLRWDAAVEGYTAAARSAERLRARAWALRARAGLGEALSARGADGDPAAGAALLAEVAREAEAAGMRGLAERAGRMQS